MPPGWRLEAFPQNVNIAEAGLMKPRHIYYADGTRAAIRTVLQINWVRCNLFRWLLFVFRLTDFSCREYTHALYVLLTSQAANLYVMDVPITDQKTCILVWISIDGFLHDCWTSLKMKSLLTVLGIQNHHSSNLWKFKGRHHWLRQDDVEGLWHLILAIRQDPHLPGGCGLARVELHLFLRFPSEIFVLFCSAILCANTFGTNRSTSLLS